MRSKMNPPVPTADRDAIIETIHTFYRSVDTKNQSLMRSVTTSEITLDGTLFVDLGIGMSEPIVGQDILVPALAASLTNITTMHNVGNFSVQLHGDRANVSYYVQAYHYKKLEEPRENPRNVYLMGNHLFGDIVKEKGEWKFEHIKVAPFFQSGNIAVMGLGN